jgi:hypothetical protein
MVTDGTEGRRLHADESCRQEDPAVAPSPSPDAAPVPPRRALPENDTCLRAEDEDDDGYDPFSDRRPRPEPTFESDPWN